MIKRTVDIELEINPVELAEEFCNMGSSEMAQFFNHVFKVTQDWKSPSSFVMQMHYVSREKLTEGGRSIMRVIGEYAKSNR
jgi:hypothetical protein